VLNKNLEQQADALYQAFFSPKSGAEGKIVTLDEYCSIFTGKKNANASVEGGKYKFFTCAPDALQINSYIYDGNAKTPEVTVERDGDTLENGKDYTE